MKKSYSENVIDYFKEVVPSLKNEHFERQRQFDKVIVWLTAMSVAAISLLIAKTDELVITNHTYLKVAAGCLLFCVFFGVMYRAFLFKLEQAQSDAYQSLMNFCNMATMETTYHRVIDDSLNKDEIIDCIVEDFGIEDVDWLRDPGVSREVCKSYYEAAVKSDLKTDKEVLQLIGRALAPILRKAPEEATDILTTSDSGAETSKRHDNLYKFCNASYYLCLAFFVLAVFAIGVGYICE